METHLPGFLCSLLGLGLALTFTLSLSHFNLLLLSMGGLER